MDEFKKNLWMDIKLLFILFISKTSESLSILDILKMNAQTFESSIKRY